MRRTSLTLALLALTAVAAAQCGECDAAPGSTITDALAAAQNGVRLTPIDPARVDSCDVNSSGTIDVLDALWIARRSAGLTQAYDCVLAPNQPPSVTCLYPTGGEMMGPLTEVAINLNAADGNGDPVDFEILYSLDWGFSWQPCTWMPGSSTDIGVPVDPAGSAIDFSWDLTTDVGTGPSPILDAKLCVSITDGIVTTPLLVVDYFYFQLP